MFHYIYKTIHENGRYYVGRHSTSILEDGYIGSGVWIKKCKDKSKLKKIILEYCETFDDLLLKEQKHISECIDDPNNMNFNDSAVGAATGSLNISHRNDVKEKLRKRMIMNNPMKNGHTEESKEKIRRSMLGEKNHFYGKNHTPETKEKLSLSRTGAIWTETQKKNLSEIRKKQFDGKKPSYLIFKNHTEESKEKIRQSALNRNKMHCSICDKLFSPHTFKRWHGEKCKQKAEAGY